MAGGNCVRNATLSAMLKAAEKSQCERLHKSVHCFKMFRQTTPEHPITPGPRKTNISEEEDKENATPAKTQQPAQLAGDLDKLCTKAIPLTVDEIEWLDTALEAHGHTDLSGVFERLIDWANTETPEVKKKLFLQVRCRRCSAGAKGGVKRDRDIQLSTLQWQWLENVQGRCKHASVGKTLRILVDFYMPFCKEDYAFEQKIFRRGAALRTDRHEDAVNNVDPARALGIRGGERTRVRAA